MRSGMMPSFIHHSESLDNPPGPNGIGANGVGQSIFAKHPLAVRTASSIGRPAESIAAQKEAAGAIAQGKRVAKRTVAHSKLAFEVGTPQIIGRHRLHKGCPIRGAMALANTRLDQAFALEQLRRGASRRQQQLGLASFKPVEHLIRPPVRVKPAHSSDLG